MNSISRLLGRALLVPISWIPISRLYGRIMRLQKPRWLALWMIRRFQKHYQVSMDEFQGKPEDYRSLSEFFLRPLDLKKRPLPADERCLLSPADGLLSEIELAVNDQATQVKGWSYPLSSLLAEPIDFSGKWHVATIYLSPRNYHRFHYPATARITGTFHGGTRLFPVNEFSVNRVKRLYIRNERVVTRFAYRDSHLYVVAVGATFVGSIGMKCCPGGLPGVQQWQPLDMAVQQMAEMGHFAMGSTIILVVPAEYVEAVLAEKGKAVRAGQPLFSLRN